jgi:hypothetical protein
MTKKYSCICLTGDFNFPGILWNDCIGFGISQDDNMFLDLLSEFSLSQLNTKSSTVHNNILDLILTTFPDSFSEIIELSNAFKSDHVPLNSNINIVTKRIKCKSRFIYNYKKADFLNIKQELEASDLKRIIRQSGTVEAAWNSLITTINKCVTCNVPIVKIGKQSGPPWFDKSIMHLRKCKQSAWRKYKRSKSASAWRKFKTFRKSLKRALKVKYDTYLNNLGDQVKNNPKVFWSFIKSKTRKGVVPETVKHGDCVFKEDVDKAEAFNKYFHSVFNTTNLYSDDIQVVCDKYSSEILELCELELSTTDVLSVLKNVDCSKATGPDNVSPILLKTCCHELSGPLCDLFNMSLSNGTLPAHWRNANVVPVHKSGSAELISNYRPISLLSVISKVLERCIFNRIYPPGYTPTFVINCILCNTGL